MGSQNSAKNELSDRYERQIIESSIGKEGQETIANGRVVIVGAGGLGSSVGMYLAAAGIGTLGIVDNDIVSASNLNRQIFYGENDLGLNKVECSTKRLREINSGICIKGINAYVDENNVEDVICDYAIVVDATDNIASKFVLNDACVKQGKTLIHAGVQGFVGQVMTIISDSSCLRCCFPEVPKDEYSKDNPRPVVGVVAGVLGQLQAAEVLKTLVNAGDLLVDTMLFVDLEKMNFKKVNVSKKDSCPACR